MTRTGGAGRGWLLAALQGAILLGLAGQLVLERALRPRGWARTEPVDPSLPIRGRYVLLRLWLPADERAGGDLPPGTTVPVRLEVRHDELVARPARDAGPARPLARIEERDGRPGAGLIEPLAFFLGEGVPDPSQRPAGEELWVEVTVPAAGPPRPIRLGVRPSGAEGTPPTPLPLR